MFQQNVEELATLQISQSPHEVLEQQLPQAEPHAQSELERKFTEAKFAYAHFAQTLDEMVAKIPDWIPVVGSLLEGQVKQLKSSIALGLGIDPEHPDQPLKDWTDRLKTAGKYMGESLLSQLKSLYEVLSLVGTGGGSIAAEAASGGAGAIATQEFTKLLGKLGGEKGAETLVTLLPDALKNVLPKVNDVVAQQHLDQLVSVVRTFVDNPDCQQAIAEGLKSQQWWIDFQASIQSGELTVEQAKAKVAEVQAAVEKEVGNTPLVDQFFRQKVVVNDGTAPANAGSSNT